MIPARCVYAWHWSEYPGVVKIGFTTIGERRWLNPTPMPTDYPASALPDLGERVLLKTLATDSPRKVEGFVHMLLSAHRCGGEWFRVTPNEVARIFNAVEQLIDAFQPTATEDVGDAPILLD